MMNISSLRLVLLLLVVVEFALLLLFNTRSYQLQWSAVTQQNKLALASRSSVGGELESLGDDIDEDYFVLADGTRRKMRTQNRLRLETSASLAPGSSSRSDDGRRPGARHFRLHNSNTATATTTGSHVHVARSLGLEVYHDGSEKITQKPSRLPVSEHNSTRRIVSAGVASATRDDQLFSKGGSNCQEEDKGPRKLDPSMFQLVYTSNGPTIVRKRRVFGPEPLVEQDESLQGHRELSDLERSGGNVMFTLRTMLRYHTSRVPVLMETWLTTLNRSKLFIVTDGEDGALRTQADERGMRYVVVPTECGNMSSGLKLCCKAGTEFSLAFQEENLHYDWFCHVDDDMYVVTETLVNTLAGLRGSGAKGKPLYFGYPGSDWRKPRCIKGASEIGAAGFEYHFAVGGLYCLSREMLTLVQPHLGTGLKFSDACLKLFEPEDVTVGAIIGSVFNLTLSRTTLIHSHGVHLGLAVDPHTLASQIAFSYGYGSLRWGEEEDNVVCVPGALFPLKEDRSQFWSLHCHLHPELHTCLKQKQWLQTNSRLVPQGRWVHCMFW